MLFSPRLTDLVMFLHAAEVINVHWTKEIEAEWSRNVVAKHDAGAEAIQTCLRGMRDAVDGWEVSGYAKHEVRFEAVEATDRHVAAAAYKLSLDDWPGQKVALLTKNVKDFPSRAFAGTLVSRHSSSGYIDALYAADPALVAKVAEACRKKLKHPPLTRERYVAVLMRHGCVGLARALSELWFVECPNVAKDGTLFYDSDVPTKKSPAKVSARMVKT